MQPHVVTMVVGWHINSLLEKSSKAFHESVKNKTSGQMILVRGMLKYTNYQSLFKKQKMHTDVMRWEKIRLIYVPNDLHSTEKELKSGYVLGCVLDQPEVSCYVGSRGWLAL